MTPSGIVYIVRSMADETKTYIGLTSDLTKRVEAHNSGGSRYTAGDRPWRVEVAVHFAQAETAVRFERYLKSGSGRAFVRRHFTLP